MPSMKRAPNDCRSTRPELVAVGRQVEVTPGLDVGPPVEQRLGDLAQRGHRGGELGEVDRRVVLPAGVLGLGDVVVQQRPLRARQRDLLVVGVDLHPPRVGLAVDEVHRGLVVRDVVGELLDHVAGVGQRQEGRPRLLGDLAQARVERDELGVVHDPQRVVADAGMAAAEVGPEVGLGHQLRDQPRVEPEVGELTGVVRAVDDVADREARSPRSGRSPPGRRRGARAWRTRRPRRRRRSPSGSSPASSDIWLCWNLKRFLSRQYAGDHCSDAWASSSEP